MYWTKILYLPELSLSKLSLLDLIAIWFSQKMGKIKWNITLFIGSTNCYLTTWFFSNLFVFLVCFYVLARTRQTIYQAHIYIMAAEYNFWCLSASLYHEIYIYIYIFYTKFQVVLGVEPGCIIAFINSRRKPGFPIGLYGLKPVLVEGFIKWS